MAASCNESVFMIFLSVGKTAPLCAATRASVLKQPLNIIKSAAGAWMRLPAGAMLSTTDQGRHDARPLSFRQQRSPARGAARVDRRRPGGVGGAGVRPPARADRAARARR